MPFRDANGEIIGTVGCGRVVTEQKLALKALKESEQRLALALKSGGLGMWDWDLRTGRMILNDRAWEIMGYNRGAKYTRYEHWLRKTDPAHRVTSLRAFELHAAGKTEVFESEQRVLTRSGSWIWTMTLGAIIDRDDYGPVRAVGTILDITERKQSQEKIQQQLDFLNTVLASLTHPFFIVTPSNFKILKANPAAIQKGIVEGAKCYHALYYRSEACDPDDCLVEKIKSTLKPATTERMRVEGNSDAKYFEVHGYPVLDRQGSLLSVIIYGHDVTDKRRAKEIQVQNAQYMAIADLAAGVAHNFNNLLQVIVGNASIGLMNLESSDLMGIKKNFERIVASSRFGAETVQRLNKIAKTAIKGDKSHRQVIDFSRLVKQAREMTKQWWKTKPRKEGRTITTELDLGEDCFVNGSIRELYDVVVSLIKNAAEAISGSGKIRLTTSIDNDKVVFKINDSGVGISEADLERLWTPFFTNKTEGAAGLELAMCRTVIKNHAGEIFVESTENLGTTFTIVLPYAGNSTQDTAASGKTTEKALILIVDNIEAILRILEDGLKAHGHGVLTATSAAAALETIGDVPIDVIICDSKIPDMDGSAIAKRTKEIFSERGLPKPRFIMLTDRRQEDYDKKAMKEAGIDSIIRKPINIDNLIAVINIEH